MKSGTLRWQGAFSFGKSRGILYNMIVVCLEGMGYLQMDDNIRGRLQARIDELNRRLRIDSNDLDYESHLRQKRELQKILDNMAARERA